MPTKKNRELWKERAGGISSQESNLYFGVNPNKYEKAKHVSWHKTQKVISV